MVDLAFLFDFQATKKGQRAWLLFYIEICFDSMVQMYVILTIQIVGRGSET